MSEVPSQSPKVDVAQFLSSEGWGLVRRRLSTPAERFQKIRQPRRLDGLHVGLRAEGGIGLRAGILDGWGSGIGEGHAGRIFGQILTGGLACSPMRGDSAICAHRLWPYNQSNLWAFMSDRRAA